MSVELRGWIALKAESTQSRIAVLDGWRCFSILLVIYGHLARWSSLKHILPFSGYAGLGVAFFFVISGFVICSGLTREFEIYGRVSIGGFYVRRCFRILPSLILFLISVWALKIVPPRSIGNAALFLCNLASCDLKIAHTWSLAYEEQFYILFPIALVLLLTRQQRWPFLALMLAWPVGVSLLYYFKATFLASFLGWFELLLFGATLALYRAEATRIVRYIGPIGLYVAVPLIFAADVSGTRTAILITLFIEYPLIAYALFASTCLRTSLHPILESKPARYLGRISYGIYLFQQPLLCADDGQGPLFYFAAVIGIVLAAAVSYAFIEAPLIRCGARLSDRVKASARFSSAPA
jgi:peptidoglycan/LPS O-acetylase OafA/YrhL